MPINCQYHTWIQRIRELRPGQRMFYEEGKTRKEITKALGIRDRHRVIYKYRGKHTVKAMLG